jgi:hypothetical protein
MKKQEEKLVIKRHDGEKRFYEFEGEYYPSSTTILEAYPMAYGMREFLQSNTKSEAEQIRNAAAIQGSKIHHTIELILSGRGVSPEGIEDDHINFLGLVDRKLVNYLKDSFSEKEDKMMKGFMQFWEDYKVKMIESERIVFSKKFKYAGTLDFIGEITIPATKKEKEKTIKILLDFKTGKGLYPEYDLQIASYWKAYKEMAKHKGTLKIGLLQLGINKCGYKLKIVENPKKLFEKFKIIKLAWEMVNPDAKPTDYEFANIYQVNLLKGVKSAKK